jgi:thioredoxin
MNTVELGQNNFDDIVYTEGVVLIDCWAPWCQGCRQFEPVFEAAASRHQTHTFAKVNTHTEGDLSKKLGVKHIPTLLLFRDGILLMREPGYVPAEGLDEIVAKAQSLDMDRVRAELDKEEVRQRA